MFEAFWLQASKYIHPVPFYCHSVASFRDQTRKKRKEEEKKLEQQMEREREKVLCIYLYNFILFVAL